MGVRGNPNWKKGYTGNPNGRPRVPEIELFRNALAQVEKEKKVSLLFHAVNRAYQDDNVLVALLKKILPDKLYTEIEDKTKNLDIESRREAIKEFIRDLMSDKK